MTTARQIISGAMRFHLNRLSPGETMNEDDAAVMLEALNHIADEFNGQTSFLFREILTTGTVTATTGTLGTTWAALTPGTQIEGAYWRDSSNQDWPLPEITLGLYQEIVDKSRAGDPEVFAHDGYALLYFYPVPTSATVILRTRQVVSDFADLDTDYGMPNGYKSALSAMLAEKVAPAMIGGVTPGIAVAARSARNRLSAQAVNPAILNGHPDGQSLLVT